MPRGLGRLPVLLRRGSGRDADVDVPPPPRPVDPDAEPVGPPLLLPAAIIRQILFEATELTPAWALPRVTTTAAIVAAPPPVAEAKPAKRPRRSNPSMPPTQVKPSTPRRSAASREANAKPAQRGTRRTKGDA
jgi:hypothetical protein